MKLFVLLLIIPTMAFSQLNKEYRELKLETQKLFFDVEFDYLNKVNGPKSKKKFLAQNFEELDKTNELLFEYLDHSAESEKIGDNYIETFKTANQQLLNSLETHDYDKVLKIINFMKKDYSTKVVGLQKSLNLNMGVNDEVLLTVETKGGEGYKVFARYLWQPKEKKTFKFNNLTNDTAKYFPQGSFMFSIYKNNELIQEQEANITLGMAIPKVIFHVNE